MNFAKKIHKSTAYHLWYDENENSLRKLPYAICFRVETKAIKSYCFASTCGIVTILLSFMCIAMYTWPGVFWREKDLLRGFDNALLGYSANSTLIAPDRVRKTESYILDTSGCRIEDIAPFDSRFPEIKEAFQVPKIPKCVNSKNNLTKIDRNNILRLNQDVRRDYYRSLDKCTYQMFDWNKDDKNGVIRGQKVNIKLDGENKIPYDFVWVECTDTNGKIIFANAHSQIFKRNKTHLGLKVVERNEDNRLNVIALGIDSISRLNFLRHCPEVHEYITKKLGGIVLEGFNKVADNTLANLYPMVTGRDVMSDWKTLMFSAFDDLDFTFKDFAKEGYATSMAEEMIGLHHPTMIPKAFKNPPADHYHRPFRLLTNIFKNAVPAHKNKLEQKLCHGSHDRSGEMLDWTENFANVYKDNKFFALTFLSNATHWHLNDVGRYKEKLLTFFKNLKDIGTFDNTMVILFADHGFRMAGNFFSSYIGAYEARLPMVYIMLPKWFSRKHPVAYENLKRNTHKLTTFYDIHQTFHDLLENQFPRNDQYKTVTKYGTSLFGPIPETRTCSEAGIEDHWCACGTFESVSLEDPRAQKAGEILFDAIKNYNKINITDGQCIDFTSFELTEAGVKVQRSGDGKSKVAKQELSLSIKVQPRGAQFRSTVAVDKGKLPMLGPVERLDNYGSQSACLQLKNPVIEVTCICKDWKPSDNAWIEH